MNLSTFEVFKVGVGPSSSHTMGPMLAARYFVTDLEAKGLLERAAEVFVQLYGSLALTGLGHCTDRAILLGLEGHDPSELDPAAMEPTLARIRGTQRIRLAARHEIAFDEPMNLLFHRDQMLPGHSNGMRFTARDAAGQTLLAEEMYSIGGGAVQREGEPEAGAGAGTQAEVPLPFANGEELLAQCARAGLSIDGLTRVNERAMRSDAEIDAKLDRIWSVMQACVSRGFAAEGGLPGVLRLPRRAPRLKRELDAEAPVGPVDPMEWVNAWALAVNEETAAGGQVVTAPTNGAAGIVPAVLHYYAKLVPGSDAAGVRRFLLTAGAIGLLYKRNASISGAEMGCQGEVGVACSMAAAGLAAALGASDAQVENAAEIGMEHNLGLTCDPIAGLVQIPCIERNAMGAVKAINAARLALRGDGTHKVSLDQVIATMRQTGYDMKSIYKETSQGGLAVNVPEC
ncbi:MAG TPA: L-serine ammonia-lyase [Steroidobacteraceae bacterium]|nr:L-serine ammonia-lyase [Steroidobacteraceae bacterium]